MNLVAIGLFWLVHGMATWHILHVKIMCLFSFVFLVLNVVVSSCRQQPFSEWRDIWQWHIGIVGACWVWFLQFSHEYLQEFDEESTPENLHRA